MKKKAAMKKKTVIIFSSGLLVAVLVLCAIYFTIPKGVEFREGNTLEISGMVSNGCFLYDVLCYDGRFYESQDFPGAKSLVDSECAPEKVYLNMDHYYADEADILLKVTRECDLYKAKDYDKEFRVIVSYTVSAPDGEQVTHYKMFDCLNGITMKYGKDLYRDRLHLENFDTVYFYSGKERDEKNDLEKHILTEHKMSEKDAEALIEMLCKARFIEESTETSEIEKKLKNYWDWKVTFVLADGTKATVCLDREGYVLYSGRQTTEAIVRVEAEKVAELLAE